MNKRSYTLLLVLVLFALPACRNKKTDRAKHAKRDERTTVSQAAVNIPLAGSTVAMNDDEDIMSLFEDEGDADDNAAKNQSSAVKIAESDTKDFNWVEEK